MCAAEFIVQTPNRNKLTTSKQSRMRCFDLLCVTALAKTPPKAAVATTYVHSSINNRGAWLPAASVQTLRSQQNDTSSRPTYKTSVKFQASSAPNQTAHNVNEGKHHRHHNPLRCRKNHNSCLANYQTKWSGIQLQVYWHAASKPYEAATWNATTPTITFNLNA